MDAITKRAVQYIRNTGETATIAQFDDDHEPIGTLLRDDIVPRYAVADDKGILKLTEEGRQVLK